MRKLSCLNFEATLQQRMDERLPLVSDRGLFAHAELCHSCAELYLGFLELEEGLVALVGPNVKTNANPSNSSKQSRLEVGSIQLAAAQRDLVHGRWGLVGWAASIAAVLLISLGLSGRFLGSPEMASKTPSLDSSYAAAPVAADDVDSSIGSIGGNARIPSGNESELEIPPIAPIAMQDVSWDQISEQFVDSPYFRYSAELPGVRPIHSSIGVTMNLLRRTFHKQERRSPEKKPDLGMLTLFDFQRV